MNLPQPKLYRAAAIVLIIVLAVAAIVFAKTFLVPVAFAALLAMLLVPVSKWLQKKGMGKTVSIILSVLTILIAVVGIGLLIKWQVSNLAEDASNIEKKVSAQYKAAQQYISNTLGVPPEKQQEMIKQQQSSSTGKLSSTVTGILGGVMGILADFLLVLVYTFLFLFFRDRLKNFIVKLVPDTDKEKALKIVNKSQQVSQKYLSGMALMIVMLWILYGIGFSIAGVKNALFFAVLCGLLEIIPFIGNITGTALTLIMVLVQGGGSNMIIGVLVTYALVQFIQSYLLEPMIVGSEVNINPLFTIMGLVAAEAIWGVPGMVLAIPVMGIAKIVCDNIEPLKPYGYLIGEDKKNDTGLKKKVKDMIQKIRKK